MEQTKIIDIRSISKKWVGIWQRGENPNLFQCVDEAVKEALKGEPSIQEDISVWEDFANEFEQLQRMEENTWEWNKKILQESYKITRLDSKPQPLQEDGLEEILFQYINSPEYYTDGNKQAFKRGYEYSKQLNK